MHFMSCQYTSNIISNLFSIFTFLSAIRRVERGTVLDEPPVDPLLVVETSITRTDYPNLLLFAHMEQFLHPILMAGSPPELSSQREYDLTRRRSSPSHRATVVGALASTWSRSTMKRQTYSTKEFMLIKNCFLEI